MKKDTLTMRVAPTLAHQLYPRALMPCDDQGYAELEKLGRDEEVQIRIVRERSNPQLRLFWSILQHVAENTDWEDPERLLIALKVRLGRYDVCKLPSGKAVPVPHSIAFDKMDQAEFQTFMERAIAVICEDVLGGYDSQALINEVQGYAETPR